MSCINKKLIVNSCRNAVIVVTFIVFIDFVLFCQNKDTVNWKLGINFSPEYTGIFKKQTRAKPGASLGGSLARSVGKNYYLESGIVFSDKGYLSKLYTVSVHNKLYPDSIERIDSFYNKVNHYFISLPLLINYSTKKKKLLFYITSGFSFNSLLASRYRQFDYNENKRTFEEYGEWVFGFTLSPRVDLGTQYNISDKTYFKIGLNLWYNLISYTPPTNKFHSGLKLYSLGLNLSYNYMFKAK